MDLVIKYYAKDMLRNLIIHWKKIISETINALIFNQYFVIYSDRSTTSQWKKKVEDGMFFSIYGNEMSSMTISMNDAEIKNLKS